MAASAAARRLLPRRLPSAPLDPSLRPPSPKVTAGLLPAAAPRASFRPPPSVPSLLRRSFSSKGPAAAAAAAAEDDDGDLPVTAREVKEGFDELRKYAKGITDLAICDLGTLEKKMDELGKGMKNDQENLKKKLDSLSNVGDICCTISVCASVLLVVGLHIWA